MAAPRVSVCIPAYQGAATIRAAIDSVLAQRFGDFELLVVDDRSPDGTADIARSFRDPRVRVLQNERNLGAEGNWNRCLDESRGHYFKLLPHDDVLHADCLLRQVRAFEADPAGELTVVFSARDVLDPAGRVIARRGYPGAREGRLAAARVVGACIRRGTNLIGEPGAVLMRTAQARRAGRFDAANPYVIDLDYWCRLLAFGDAHYDPAPLAAFRVSATQWSVAIGTRQSRDFKRFVERQSRCGLLPSTAWDRLCGSVTPGINNLLRLAFYRINLK